MNLTKGLRVKPYTWQSSRGPVRGVAIMRGTKLLQFFPTVEEAMRLADQIVDTAEQLEVQNG